MKQLTQKQKADMLDMLFKSGIITKETVAKGIVGKSEEKKPRKLGEFKDSKGNTIDISTYYDKEGCEYISQTKVLKTGVRTKGFAIPIKEFKAYVSLLNSIVDKMNK